MTSQKVQKRNFVEERLLRFRLPIIIATHVVIFLFSIWFAFELRFDFIIDETYLPILYVSIPVFIVIKLVVFFFFQQFSGWWRYVTLHDLLHQVRASIISMFLAMVVILSLSLSNFPRSIFLLDFIITILALSSVRVTIRLYRERFSPGIFISTGDNLRTIIMQLML